MVNKLSRILVAIDFSESSLNALDTAVALASKSGASLYAVHVQNDPMELIGSGTLTIRSVSDNSSSILSAMAGDIQSRTGIELVIIEESGHPAELILRTAVKCRCDLVIAGTYGASGYRNGHIGTTAYNIVKYAPCPVLLVPKGKKWISFRNPLLPIRPVTTALRHYDFIRTMVEPHTTLNVLALYQNGDHDVMYDVKDLVAKIEGKLTEDKVKAAVTRCNTVNNIPQTILKEADEAGADLIIVTPATDVSNKQFYIGPNMHYVVNHVRIPLLVIGRVNRYVLENAGTSL